MTIKDSENRVGIADILVPDPTDHRYPASSQRGSTVTVIGSNFPAEDLVTVTYAGDTVTATTTDTVGNWRGTFSVPVDAAIGEEHEVVAQSEKKADGEVENNIKKSPSSGPSSFTRYRTKLSRSHLAWWRLVPA